MSETGVMLPIRPLSTARVAVVHEWLYTYAGAEKVLEQILDLFPKAEIFSLIDFLPERDRHILGGRKVHTSFLQKLPFIRKKHQMFLPLMPVAIEKFNLSSFDIILTSSYAVAKGVLTGPNQLHLCYCHSPVRYAWDLQHQYLYQWHIHRGITSIFAIWILNKLRIWDHVGSNGVDRFISNSRFISRRIWKTYRRDSKVIYPPVDTSFFVPGSTRGDAYVTVSRLVGYKRVDLLVDAFAHMPDRKLVVIGSGENLEALRKSATPNVTFLGRAESSVLLDTMQKARAFLFAAEEDFGISPVEAQACGLPVIAFGRGGALETIRGGYPNGFLPPRPTGVFFKDQTVESLIDAIRFFELNEKTFSSEDCVVNARRFTPKVFRERFMEEVSHCWNTFQLREGYSFPDW